MSFGDRWRWASVVATGSSRPRTPSAGEDGQSGADLRAEPGWPARRAGHRHPSMPRQDVRRFARVRTVVCSADDDADQRPGRRSDGAARLAGPAGCARARRGARWRVGRHAHPPARGGRGGPPPGGGRRAHRPPRRRRAAPLRIRSRHDRIARPALADDPRGRAGRARRPHRPGDRAARGPADRRLPQRPRLRAFRTGRPPGRRDRDPVAGRGAADRRRPVGRGAGDPRRPPIRLQRARHRPRPGPGRPCRDRDRHGRPHRAARQVRGRPRAAGGDPALAEHGGGGPRLAPRPGRRPPLDGRCRRAPARRRRRPPGPRGPGDRQDQVGPRRRAGRRQGPGAPPQPRARAGRGPLRAGDLDRRRLRHRRLPGRRLLRPCGGLGRVRPPGGRPVDDRGAAHRRPRPHRRHRRLHEPQGRVRRRRDRPVAELREPGHDRGPERPLHRRAGPLEGRSRPPGRRRTDPARAGRPAHNDPGARRSPRVCRRGRRAPARCRSCPARPHGPGRLPARDARGRDRRDRQRRRARHAHRTGRRDERAGDRRQGRRPHRRLPCRRPVPAHGRVRRVRERGRHPVGRGRPADRRRRDPRRPQGQRPPPRRIRPGRRRAAPRDRPAGGGRPVERPAHRRARGVAPGHRPARRRRTGAARDLGPHHGHPRSGRRPPAGRGRGGPAARRGWGDPRARRSGRRDPPALGL